MNRNQASRPVSQQTRKIPAGLVSIWPSSTIPLGWLLCDGTSYDIATYPALYAAIGNTYGSAPPTFIVPDMRTFVPYYTGVLNATGGTSTETLTAAQSGMVSHAHTYVDFWQDSEYTNVTDDAGGVSGIKTAGQVTGEVSSGLIISGTTYSSGVAASTAHTNLQPYLLINFIIKT